MSSNTFDFIAGHTGTWKIIDIIGLQGDSLAMANYLDIKPKEDKIESASVWTLTGFVSNIRYAEKTEREKLAAVQQDLGRPSATHAALIPIRKSESWWALAQDERRKIFEADSHHTEIGMRYLPAIARKLYHSRDIGQPFDFLTWFEFAPEDTQAFNDLLYHLRKSEEWKYVDREVDIRLTRE